MARALGGLHEQAGKIRHTHLGPEDHGIPTCWVELDFGGSGQGFGGYDLRHYGYPLIGAILSACGVSRWEDLNGRIVVALRDDEFGAIIGLKPLPFEKGEGFVLRDGEVQKP